MRKMLTILAILMLVGMANAAVYATTNPEAKLFFTRDRPGPDVLPVTTLFYVNGIWSNSIGIGTMDTNFVELQIKHSNSHAEPVYGTVYLELECEEGLIMDATGAIEDLRVIRFGSPCGGPYYCNNASCIEWLSDTKVKITPTNETCVFEHGHTILSDLKLEFIDYAYGNYILTVYVE